MSKSKPRERLEKRLALGMAFMNGVNTFAPQALLFARPDQVLGRQDNLPDLNRSQVALRVSAAAERKPYSCANLQSLAYSAMSAVDALAFGRAEAAEYLVTAGQSMSVAAMNSGDMMSVSGVEGSLASGTVTSMSGGTQSIDSFGTGSITTMGYRITGTNNRVSAFGGTQVISRGGTGTIVSMLGGTQFISGGVAVSTTLEGGTQVIEAGGTAVSTTLSNFLFPLENGRLNLLAAPRWSAAAAPVTIYP